MCSPEPPALQQRHSCRQVCCCSPSRLCYARGQGNLRSAGMFSWCMLSHVGDHSCLLSTLPGVNGASKVEDSKVRLVLKRARQNGNFKATGCFYNGTLLALRTCASGWTCCHRPVDVDSIKERSLAQRNWAVLWPGWHIHFHSVQAKFHVCLKVGLRSSCVAGCSGGSFILTALASFVPHPCRVPMQSA